VAGGGTAPPRRASRTVARAVALAIALALGAGPARAYDAFPPSAMSDLVVRLLPSVVSIASSRPNRPQVADSRSVGMTVPNLWRTSGSGFIVDASGLIVTNKHVVRDAVSLSVTLEDNSTYRAVLVGQGIESDIALLKIEARRELPAVTFGNSDLIRPGDPVLAIGNPLGLGGSVSAGIVSAVNRDIGGEGPFADFIQTDAAINHGNSGGPLFNAAGEVIGMNTAIFTPTAESGSVGLGFALPSRDVQFVVGQLRRYGRVHAGWLGMQVQRLTPGIREAAHLAEPATGIVSDIVPGGPAAEAGVRIGDVLVRCTEHDPLDPGSFLLTVSMLEPGHRSGLVVWRDGAEVTLPVVVQEWPTMRDAPAQAAPAELRMDAASFGLSLREPTERDRRRFEASHFTDGAVVEDIDPASPAATTTIGLGDVIRQVGAAAVGKPAEVVGELERERDAGEQKALILIENDDGVRWTTMPLR
jgi:serine protease Do